MYTLTLTEEQAAILRDAYELLARVHMGQFNAAVDEVLRRRDDCRDSMYAAKDIACSLERTMFPNGAGPRPERANVAWDLYQVVRHSVAWATLPPNEDRPAYLVQYGAPMLTSAQEPLAVCTVDEGGG